MIAADLHAALGDRIPGDHSRQVLADHYIERLSGERWTADRPPDVVDLGCGPGDSVDQFRAVLPGVRWVGVDVEDSPEVRYRTRSDAEFREFDGLNLPFDDSSVDVVYCKQVLEHVAAPGPLLADVARVLRPGGQLIGSTSQLEPYHSLSTGNPTPYGLTLIVEGTGLRMVELRPGIDAMTLIVHRGLGMPAITRRYWGRESPLNRGIGAFAAIRGLTTAQANAVKLLFCGQFAFLARKPGD